MQSISSRIWTRVAVSISYDDNHYTTGTYTYYDYALEARDDTDRTEVCFDESTRRFEEYINKWKDFWQQLITIIASLEQKEKENLRNRNKTKNHFMDKKMTA